MGKPTGFMEYKREDAPAYSVKERIKNFDEFHESPLQRGSAKTGVQDAWTAVCLSVRQECRLVLHSRAVRLTTSFPNGMTSSTRATGNRLTTVLKLQTTSPNSHPVYVPLSVKRHAPAVQTVTLSA